MIDGPGAAGSAFRNVVRTEHGTHRDAFGAAEWALFVGSALVFGSAFSLTAISLETMSPGVITVGRSGIGALTLWLLGPRGVEIERRDWPAIATLCIAWIAIPMTLVPIAQQWIDSGVAGLLAGAMPILATLIAAWLLRSAPTPRQLAGLVAGSAGVVLISLPSIGEGSTAALGIGLMLVAVLTYAVSVNIAVPLQKKYGSRALMTRILGLAALMTLPLGLFEAGSSRLTPRTGSALIALGTVGTAGAYWLMGSLVGRVGSSRSSFVAYLVPVVALGLGVVVLGESVGAMTLGGAVFVVLGALLASGGSA